MNLPPYHKTFYFNLDLDDSISCSHWQADHDRVLLLFTSTLLPFLTLDDSFFLSTGTGGFLKALCTHTHLHLIFNFIIFSFGPLEVQLVEESYFCCCGKINSHFFSFLNSILMLLAITSSRVKQCNAFFWAWKDGTEGGAQFSTRKCHTWQEADTQSLGRREEACQSSAAAYVQHSFFLVMNQIKDAGWLQLVATIYTQHLGCWTLRLPILGLHKQPALRLWTFFTFFYTDKEQWLGMQSPIFSLNVKTWDSVLCTDWLTAKDVFSSLLQHVRYLLILYKFKKLWGSP